MTSFSFLCSVLLNLRSCKEGWFVLCLSHMLSNAWKNLKLSCETREWLGLQTSGRPSISFDNIMRKGSATINCTETFEGLATS